MVDTYMEIFGFFSGKNYHTFDTKYTYWLYIHTHTHNQPNMKRSQYSVNYTALHSQAQHKKTPQKSCSGIKYVSYPGKPTTTRSIYQTIYVGDSRSEQKKMILSTKLIINIFCNQFNSLISVFMHSARGKKYVFQLPDVYCTLLLLSIFNFFT